VFYCPCFHIHSLSFLYIPAFNALLIGPLLKLDGTTSNNPLGFLTFSFASSLFSASTTMNSSFSLTLVTSKNTSLVVWVVLRTKNCMSSLLTYDFSYTFNDVFIRCTLCLCLLFRLALHD